MLQTNSSGSGLLCVALLFVFVRERKARCDHSGSRSRLPEAQSGFLPRKVRLATIALHALHKYLSTRAHFYTCHSQLSDQVVRESFPLATPRFTLPAPGCASQLPPLWIGGTCAQRSGGPTGRGLTGSASTTPPILPEIESPARKLI